MNEREEYHRSMLEAIEYLDNIDAPVDSRLRIAKSICLAFLNDSDQVWKRLEVLQDSISDLQKIVNQNNG